MTENTIGLLVLLALILINGAVSVAIARSGYYERKQLLAQVAIIWLLPAVGAIFIGVFLRTQRETSTFNPRALPERSETAAALGLGDVPHDQSSDN